MIRPDAPVVIDVARSWSYAEVAHGAAQTSAALIASGVSHGDRVGVHCNKGVEGFIAMHAVVSAGAVAVPLDPSSPPARLAGICDRMQIEVVISHAPRTASLTAINALRPFRIVVGVDLPGTDIRAIGPDEVSHFDPVAPVSVAPDDLAYIITTSGSTGEPKGIVHTHASGLAYAEMTHRTYDMTPNDRVSDIAPHHFDISTHSLWATPLIGATNVVINEAYQRLPASHAKLLEDQAVTMWYSVPFLLHQLVLRGDLENRDLSALRWVKFGGEVISPLVIGEMMRYCPNARLANVFGPAETNQCSLAVFETPPDPDRPLSVGFPLDHSEIRAIDPAADTPEKVNQVDVGEMGEMWVHTPQLMDGYWAAADVNDRVLKDVDGKRFYRSGDLISFDEHGEMTFYGRVDHQVKVRGFRIELEGIELELEQLDGPEHAVVGILRAQSGEDELVAGLLGMTQDFDEVEFLRSAASVLPAYAVPTRTVRISSASFTGSGKLDRRALREQAVSELKGQLK